MAPQAAWVCRVSQVSTVVDTSSGALNLVGFWPKSLEYERVMKAKLQQ